MQTRFNDVPVCAEARPQIADEDRTIAFMRSLRASRGRRAALALRRRRTWRGRGSVLAMAAGLFALSAGAVAQQAAPGPAVAKRVVDTIAAAQRALGVGADGVIGPRTRSATKRFQRSNGLTVDGIIGPQTLKALGVQASVPEAQAASVPTVLQRIAQCESGGDPTAVSATGRYRGKYQFDRETWRRMGGKGDAAAALEADQDAVAARLLAEAGTSPWPNCA